GDDLRVVALHGGREHDHLRVAEVRRVVADGDRDAGLAQPAHVGGIGDVGALHAVAEVVQHLGDAGHADAADADEMDRADRQRQRPHAGTSSVTRLSTRSARRAAASGRPCAPMPAAMALRSGSMVSMAWRSSRGDTGSGITIAPSARALADWWSSIACGSGIRIAGRPTAASSATVDAPARAMT